MSAFRIQYQITGGPWRRPVIGVGYRHGESPEAAIDAIRRLWRECRVKILKIEPVGETDQCPVGPEGLRRARAERRATCRR